MKASDLEPGDVIRHCPNEPGLEGWTVVELRRAGWWISHNPEEWDPCVLLKLERYEVCGAPFRASALQAIVDGLPRYCAPETRTAWLEADAEVET